MRLRHCSEGFLQVVGEQEISGVLRVTEQTSSLTPKNRCDLLGQIPKIVFPFLKRGQPDLVFARCSSSSQEAENPPDSF